MRRTEKKILVAAFCLALALCLSGCSSQETPAQPKTAAGFAPALDTKTVGSINVVGHYNNFEALEEEFNRFNQYYPEVKLSYTYLDNYSGILETALNSADAPDIYFVYPSMSGRENGEGVYASAENLADPALRIGLDCIRESLLYKGQSGSVYSVPVYTTTYGMLVNEAIFEKEKLSVPKTYEELLTVCEALKKAGYESPVMSFNQNSFLLLPLYYPYFCAQLQASPDALREVNAMTPAAADTVRPILEQAEDFMKRGFVNLENCKQLENDYNAVIMRFFEGDVPMMLATANTVSGTEKRESQSEAFTAHPFRYSFHPVPSTKDGGYFVNSISMGFAVNKNSKNLAITNEFMRFLVSSEELNRMARAKRMVTPCKDMALDEVYASFGSLSGERIINLSELELSSAADWQVRKAVWQVCNGGMTVDEAIAAFGNIE